jgi:hypothetical protein
LDGEVRKLFHGVTPDSITCIEALDESFIKQWGDRRDYLYYISEFGTYQDVGNTNTN